MKCVHNLFFAQVNFEYIKYFFFELFSYQIFSQNDLGNQVNNKNRKLQGFFARNWSSTIFFNHNFPVQPQLCT